MKKLILNSGLLLLVMSVIMGCGSFKATSDDSWTTHVNNSFGYSISLPSGWVVKEQPTQNVSPEFIIVEPNGLAFLRVVALKDPALNSEKAVVASVEEYRQKLSTEGKGSRLLAFKSDVKNGIGGFFAEGEFMQSNKLYRYHERGLLGNTGKVLLMRGAALPDNYESLQKTFAKMMDSFKIN